jgi:cell division protein FtsB
MRLVTGVLILLLVLIQYPLWWGHGGWLSVHQLQEQLAQQMQKNADEKLRNERIAGEVQDLQNGTSAVEERARYEMGMIKDGEVFVQFVSPNAPIPSPPADVRSMMAKPGDMSAAPVRVVPNPPPSQSMLRRLAREKAERQKRAERRTKEKTTAR